MIRIRLRDGKTFKTLEALHWEGMTGERRSYKIRNKLETLSRSGDGCEAIYNYLIETLKDIIVGCPARLSEIVSRVEELILSEAINRDVCFDELKKVFNYDNFVKKGRKYGAYTLTEFLQCDVCPYCNRNFSTWVQNITRPQLDHFFSQSDYPYLAVSLYNLIPACSVCNSALKKNIKFDLIQNIHPYIDDFEDKMRFTLTPIKKKSREYILSHFDSDEGDFNITFQEGSSLLPQDKKRIEANIKIFELEKLYNKHKSYATEILRKNIIFKPEIVNELFREVGLTDFADIYQVLLGNYWQKENFARRPLSKFTRDLYLYCHPDEL